MAMSFCLRKIEALIPMGSDKIKSMACQERAGDNSLLEREQKETAASSKGDWCLRWLGLPLGRGIEEA
jgi:hypothetical protein